MSSTMATNVTDNPAGIAKREGTLGYCMSFIFSEFLSEEYLKSLNEKLCEIKAKLEEFNNLRVHELTVKDESEERNYRKLIDDIPNQFPKLNGLNISIIKKNLDYFNKPTSWAQVLCAFKKETQNSISEEPNGIGSEERNTTATPSQVVDDVTAQGPLKSTDIQELHKRLRDAEDCILSYREGASKDAENVEETFSQLSFDTKPTFTEKEANSKEAFQDIMKTHLDRQRHKGEEKHEFFVLVISSHGGWDEEKNQSYICLPDGGKICLDDIYDFMENSPLLIGKRKMIFIQACQGVRKDSGKKVPDARSTSPPVTGTQVPGKPPIINPSYSDFIVHYATISRHASWRDPKEGSVFIRLLCCQLKVYYETRQLHQILMDVNKKMSEEEIRCDHIVYKQVPMLVTTSLGDFFLLSEEEIRTRKKEEGKQAEGTTRLGDFLLLSEEEIRTRNKEQGTQTEDITVLSNLIKNLHV